MEFHTKHCSNKWSEMNDSQTGWDQSLHHWFQPQLQPAWRICLWGLQFWQTTNHLLWSWNRPLVLACIPEQYWMDDCSISGIYMCTFFSAQLSFVQNALEYQEELAGKRYTLYSLATQHHIYGNTETQETRGCTSAFEHRFFWGKIVFLTFYVYRCWEQIQPLIQSCTIKSYLGEQLW